MSNDGDVATRRLKFVDKLPPPSRAAIEKLAEQIFIKLVSKAPLDGDVGAFGRTAVETAYLFAWQFVTRQMDDYTEEQEKALEALKVLMAGE